MIIDNSDTKVTIFFAPRAYIIVKDGEKWTFNYRIDRSEKGKDDDIGDVRVVLEPAEVDVLKKLGFGWVDLSPPVPFASYTIKCPDCNELMTKPPHVCKG